MSPRNYIEFGNIKGGAPLVIGNEAESETYLGVKIVSHESFMPSAYNACDLVLSASIEPEAFGRVAVEAQAMEKPILASNIGGSNETIIDGQTGWLFKSDDEKDLAKMIIEISKKNKSFLKDLGAKGRANVMNNYTVDQMCSKTLEIYKSLV